MNLTEPSALSRPAGWVRRKFDNEVVDQSISAAFTARPELRSIATSPRFSR